jgi:hypothetical protein
MNVFHYIERKKNGEMLLRLANPIKGKEASKKATKKKVICTIT